MTATLCRHCGFVIIPGEDRAGWVHVTGSMWCLSDRRPGDVEDTRTTAEPAPQDKAPSYLTDLIQGNIFHPDEAETLIRMIRERTAHPPTVEVQVTVNHDETEVRLQYVSEEPPPVKYQAAFLAARILNFESHALHLETSEDGRTVTARLEGTR